MKYIVVHRKASGLLEAHNFSATHGTIGCTSGIIHETNRTPLHRAQASMVQIRNSLPPVNGDPVASASSINRRHVKDSTLIANKYTIHAKSTLAETAAPLNLEHIPPFFPLFFPSL
jgi:hypothetical protein